MRADFPPPPAGKHGWPWDPGPDAAPPSGRALPRITVVTPSYNQADFLEATIRSVLLQQYENLEYIVLDGGSTDGSVDIIRRYAPWLTHWRSGRDDGQAAAIAEGFAIATGDVYCWLNSDDVFLPGALRKAGEFFARHPGVDFLYGNRIVIDRAGEEIDRHFWPAVLTRAHWALGQPMAQECCFWRASIYQRVGGIDPTRFFIMDWDLFFRMWRAGNFHKSPEFFGAIRIHDESKNTRYQDVRERELAEARARYGLREPGWLKLRLLNRSDRLQRWVETRRAR